MLLRVPQLLRNYKPRHKAILGLAGGQSLSVYATGLMYLYLPILLSVQFNESIAGILIGFSGLITLLALPLAGYIADRRSALTSIRAAIVFFFISALLRLLLPLTITSVCLIIVFFSLGYGFRIYKCYILRMAPSKKGGLLFGLVESIMAIGSTFATLSLPYVETQAYPFIPTLLMVIMGLYFIITLLIPTDHPTQEEKIRLNYVQQIKKGIHFIQVNKGYPRFHLSTMLFEGIFYASIWFLFPLYLVHESTQAGWLEGLSLGIYEIVTIFLAGLCGWVADRYGWKLTNILGWTIIIYGMIGLLFNPSLEIIIFLGAGIALGNNLIYGASTHILEKKDQDHAEDGSFTALEGMVTNLGYIILPAILGTLYYQFGFQSSLTFLVCCVCLLGIVMIRETGRR